MSWFLAFAGFAVLIVLHEFGHFIAAKWVGMRVERFFLFFPPKVFSVRRGETEYGIGALPLGGFVKISGMNPDEDLPPEVAPRGYYKQPVWKRIVVIAAGPAVNVLIAFILIFILAFSVKEATTNVDRIESGSPASRALQSGDRIISVDGRRTEDVAALARQVNRHRCEPPRKAGCTAATPARLRIERDGRTQTIAVRPEYDANLKRMRLGFAFATKSGSRGPIEAADLTVSFMWEITHRSVGVIVRIFDAEQREQISGVVGSYEVTRQAIDFDTRRAITLLAVISLSLAIINLFPFLPLDGGHIFWSIVEKVRRRPVSFATMERAGALGFVLVLMLFAIGLSNDIDRLTGEGFRVR